MYDPYRDPNLGELHRARNKATRGSSETGMVIARVQNAMSKGWKIPIIEIEVQGWILLAPLAGFFAGGAIGKLLDKLAIGHLAKALTNGAFGFEGVMTVAGIVAALVLWVKLQHSLKFIRTMAILMAAMFFGLALGATVDEGSQLKSTIISVALALIIPLVFPYLWEILANALKLEQIEGKQYLCIGTLIVLVVVILFQPAYSLVVNFDLFRLPPLVWLGAPGGFVLASLWGTTLWYWGGD